MRKELEQRLVERWPTWFNTRGDFRYTAMPRGFEHDDGWFDILWRLCEDLEPLVASVEAVPFISFASHHRGNGGGMWEKMYHYFQFKHTEFLQHYHKRRNVESTFSMMKREFGDGLRSKTDVAMVNESLCNILS